MKDLNELRRKRATLIKDARAILDKAETEKREMTAEENGSYEKMFADVNKLAAEIEREEKQQVMERSAQGIQTTALKPDGASTAEDKEITEKRMASFKRFLIGGRFALAPEERGLLENRALQADSDIAGGYLMAPQQYVNTLIKAVDNLVFMRQFATLHQMEKAESLGAPSLSADPADPTWTSELATGDEDSTMKFGKRELFPHPLAQRIKVSNKLLSRSVQPVDSIVRDRLAYKIAVVSEYAYQRGSGSGQPLGVFIPSSDGISTGRDVSTGNTATAITFDGLKEAKYTLKGQYWPKARWIFHRDAVKMISKLKDGEGRYIWQGSVVAAEPDRLLNFPVHMSEYTPNTFEASQYVGILGDLSFYWIADALSMQIQVLNELYALTNQTGYISRLESDGLPVLEEAFVRVKLAA